MSVQLNLCLQSVYENNTVVNPTHHYLDDFSVKSMFTAVCLWKWKHFIAATVVGDYIKTMKTTFLFIFKLEKSTKLMTSAVHYYYIKKTQKYISCKASQ